MRQLVKRARDGDGEAFLALMEQYSGAMYKIARSILGNNEDAADAIQETILICFEKIAELRQPRYFKTWMTRILINECRKIIRQNSRNCLLEEFPDVPVRDASLEYVEFQELIRRLDEKYRLILVLRYVQGLKIREIAELLELPENTVKTRLQRGRKSLAEEYKTPGEIAKPGRKGALWNEKQENEKNFKGGNRSSAFGGTGNGEGF